MAPAESEPGPTLDRMRQVARLWSQAQPAVSALITATVINFHDAEDLLGQVAETVVGKLDEYDPSRPFTGWAIGIARKRILQYLDKRTADRHLYFDAETVELMADAHVEAAAEAPARLTALRSCLELVQGKGREALELRYVQGLNAASIAGRLAMNAGAVWTLLHRLRKGLEACIEKRIAIQGGGP